MIQFPKAKINLGLYVTEKREDGYHNLETIMVPIEWCDILEIGMVEDLEGVESKISGLIESVGDDNSCTDAYRLIAKDHKLPGMRMHLHKQIPTGAGLGGGSSDAAYCLNMLNDMMRLGLSKTALEGYASELGADNAFFIRPGAKLCTGIGDVMEDLEPLNKSYHLIMVNPGIHVSTAEAYAGISPEKPVVDLKNLWSDGPETWKSKLYNGFEKSVFEAYPEIAKIKEQLYEEAAVYAAMSGSGSTVFGLFENEPKGINFPQNYTLHQSVLKL